MSRQLRSIRGNRLKSQEFYKMKRIRKGSDRERRGRISSSDLRTGQTVGQPTGPGASLSLRQQQHKSSPASEGPSSRRTPPAHLGGSHGSLHCPPLSDQHLAGMPPAATKPRSHWITLSQPPSTTRAVSCPYQPSAVLRVSPSRPFRGPYEVLLVEYHVQGHPSPKNLLSGYNEVGRKSMQL
jgi:hypothetical protein